MAKNSTLEKLIRRKEIQFHSYGRKLSTRLKDYGEYNWNLVRNIMDNSGNAITIKGNSLENYLKEPRNLYHLTNFMIQLWSVGEKNFGPSLGMNLHVDVDINNFSNSYKQQNKEKMVNGFHQQVGDAATWVREMPYFEKVWNFALCNAIGGLIGSPGYEFPLNDKQFRYHVSLHAENFMIGTREQIKRYDKYALEHLSNITTISDKLKADPSIIFNDKKRYLQGIENNTRSARRISDNIVHFSDKYKT